MKLRSISWPLFLLLMFCVLASTGVSQAPETNKPETQATEQMGENDRLPFMQTAETGDPAEPSSSGLLIKTIGAMLLVVALIFAGAWVAKKAGFGGTKVSVSEDNPALAVLTSVSMGSGRTISTVRFGDRFLLIGVTPQAITLLAEETKDVPLQSSRSVAEMLAEENGSFVDEFENARARLGLWEEREGNI